MCGCERVCVCVCVCWRGGDVFSQNATHDWDIFGSAPAVTSLFIQKIMDHYTDYHSSFANGGDYDSSNSVSIFYVTLYFYIP